MGLGSHRGPGTWTPGASELGSVASLTQTRTYLGPEEVLKGLQGEIEEVLGSISLSVSVLKRLYSTYDFCCSNMKLFFKVRPDGGPGGLGGPRRKSQNV